MKESKFGFDLGLLDRLLKEDQNVGETALNSFKTSAAQVLTAAISYTRELAVATNPSNKVQGSYLGRRYQVRVLPESETFALWSHYGISKLANILLYSC